MSEKVTAMIEEIKGLTVLELSELVHALEEEFGVSAAAMAAPAAGGAAPAADRVRRHPRRFRRCCQDQGHQGCPRDRWSGSGRGQGFRRVRSEGSEGGRVQGGCRELQEAARRGWREGRDQVISPYCEVQKARVVRHGLFLFDCFME